MDVVWLTFDAQNRPVWLSNGGGNTQKSTEAGTGAKQYWVPLYQLRYFDDGTWTYTQVGQVAITFLPGSTTQAALRWQWDAAGITTIHDECVYNYTHAQGANAALASTVLDESYTGNWYSEGASGWGLLLSVGTPAPGDPHTQPFELDFPVIFDINGYPVWLYGQNFNMVTTNVDVPLYYSISKYTGGIPSYDCSVPSCIQTTAQQVGHLSRSFSSPVYGSSTITASVDAGMLGNAGTTKVSWPDLPNTHLTNPRLISKLTDINMVAVNRTVCRLASGETTCPVVVSWGSTDPGARVYRVPYPNNAKPATPIASTSSGQVTENLPATTDVRYVLYAGNGSTKLFTSPEVKVLAAGLPALPPPVTDTAPTHYANVGATQGEAGASGGAATYNIPIVVPPGRAGIEPTLSLDYSSRGGNGIAGVGWSLGGLSAIHRCPQTPEQDGQARAVSYTADDKLCLDGHRLVRVSGSTYGHDGAVYATEVDSYARVYQYGSLADDSACFRVEQKDGRILHYGGVMDTRASCAPGLTSYSRVKPNASVPLSWLIEKAEDRVGNNEMYSYTQYSAGQNVPSKILYTGKGAGAGNRAVTFGYATRPNPGSGGNDISSSYLAGFVSMQTVRLAQIATYTGYTSTSPGAMVRRYTLTYENGTAGSTRSGRSLLSSITECAYTGGTACRPPTKFTWNGSTSVEDVVAHKLHVPDALKTSGIAKRATAIGDVDGDGTRELVIRQTESTGDHTYLLKYDADRNFQSYVDATAFYSMGVVVFDPRYTGDVGGDGRADFVAPSTTSNGFFDIYTWNQQLGRGAPLSAGTGLTTGATPLFVAVHTDIPYASGDSLQAVADFNGDGYTDILVSKASSSCTTPTAGARTLCLYTNKDHVPLGTTTYHFDPGVVLQTLQGVSQNYVIESEVELNGDGVPDILVSENVIVGNAISGPFLHHVLLSDLANVGKAGCTHVDGTRYLSCPVSSLNLLRRSSDPTHLVNGDDVATFWMDVNGDGLQDLVFGSIGGCNLASAKAWCIQLATGNGFTNPITVDPPASQPSAPPPGLEVDETTIKLLRASKLPQIDVDATGKPELLYPVALAAQICYQEVGQYESADGGNTCPGDNSRFVVSSSIAGTSGTTTLVNCVYNVCSNDPGNSAYILPTIDGKQSIAVGSRAPTYGSGPAFDDDLSVYRMGALRFEQVTAASFRWAQRSVDTSDATRPTHEVLARLDPAFTRTEDLYGDGLPDLVSSLGCTYSTSIKLGKVVGTCIAQPTPTANLPDGTPVSSLQDGAQVYVNENVGAGMRNNGALAPVLPELLAQSVNGLGDSAEWTYFPLSSSAGRGANGLRLYSVDGSFVPDDHYFYFDSSMPVVSDLAQSNGIGGKTGARSAAFSYGSAIYNHLGRGFQGFRSIAVDSVSGTDTGRHTRTTTTFNQKFPLSGKIESVIHAQPETGKTFRTEEDGWICSGARTTCPTVGAPGVSYTPLLDTQIVKNFDLATGVQYDETDTYNYLTTTPNVSGWDVAYGNLLKQTVTRSDRGANVYVASHTTIKSNSYTAADVNTWWINRLNNSVVSSSLSYAAGYPFPGAAVELTKQSSVDFVWNPDRTLASKTVQKGLGGDQELVTTYAYPATSFGLPSSVTVFAPGQSVARSPSRTTGFTYTNGGTSAEPDGYFVYEMTSGVGAFNYKTRSQIRISDGQASLVTDPNLTQVKTTFDPFGKPTKVEHLTKYGANIESPVQFSTTPCLNTSLQPNHCLAGGLGKGANEDQAAYEITTVQAGYPTKVTWYDLLGRVVKTAERGFTGAFSQTLTDYDDMGSVAEKFSPFFGNTAGPFSSWFYDALSRPIVKTSPAPNPADPAFETLYSYNGNTTTITAHAVGVTCPGTASNLCMQMTRSTNVLGQIMTTKDAKQNYTYFWTEPLGHVAAMKDTEGNITFASYDVLGRRTSMDDPDQHRWRFYYDAFGDFRGQVDARNVVTQVNSRDVLGRLTQQQIVPPATVPTGMVNETQLDTWTYDPTEGIGKIDVVQHQSGANTTPAANAVTWSETYTYENATSRLVGTSTFIKNTTLMSNEAYDAFGRLGSHTYPSGLEVQYGYGPYGQLASYGGPDPYGTTMLYWEATAMDAWGQITGEAFADGIVGTMSNSPSTGQEQTAAWSTAAGATVDALTYGYDSLGNLISQTRQASAYINTETYAYDTLQRLTSTSRPFGQVKYGYSSSGNILYKTDFSKDTSATPKATPPYVYGIGNCGKHAVSSVTLPNGSTQTYTCDLNGNVIGGTTLTATFDVSNRMRSAKRTGGYTDGWFYDSNGQLAYETSSIGGGARYYGPAGYEQTYAGQKIHELGPAIVTRTNGVDTVTSVLRDRLGSVIDTLVDSAPMYANARSYDAFGKVRQGNLQDRTNGTLNLPGTVHGFTKHEHVDDVMLIHMGGRVYDYQLGRFLSVDPIIGNRTNSQSLNPYSYVGNNPLSGVDPTGYQAVPIGHAPCNGDEICVALQNREFIGGGVAQALAGLQYGGAPTGHGVGANGGVWNDSKSGNTSSWVTVGALSDVSSKTNGDASSTDYSGCRMPTKSDDLSWDGYVDLGLMGQYYNGKPTSRIEKVGVDPLTGENLDRRTAIFVVESIIGGGVGGKVLGPLLGKIASFFRPVAAGIDGSAARAGSAFAREAGILRDAARGKGNFGLGSGTRADAERLGRAWVGDGAKFASDGKTLVSADGLRQFRPPSFKPNLGIEQANFEQRLVPSGQWFGNGHLDIGP
jgi:RHS repeat-associated protein